MSDMETNTVDDFMKTLERLNEVSKKANDKLLELAIKLGEPVYLCESGGKCLSEEEWIAEKVKVYVCPNCEEHILQYSNFCPNCGKRIEWICEGE